jgi:hypothetical protein
MLRATRNGIEIAPLLAPTPPGGAGEQLRADPVPAYADPAHWQVALHIAGHGHRLGDPWSRSEITHALRAWTTQHGQPPHIRHWARASTEHPNYTTVFRWFGTWRAALKAAGLGLAPVDRHTHQVNGRYAPLRPG